MGEMARMDGSGDFRVTWNPNNAREVQDARGEFDRLMKSGHAAYKIDPHNDARGEQIRTFDPWAARIIVVPQMAGG